MANIQINNKKDNIIAKINKEEFHITLCKGGTNGYSGYSGAKGDTGATGTSGYSGYSGKDGFIGGSGYSGFSGAKGDIGTSGYSGNKGDTGTSGYSGFSGIKGDSGTSGYSGFSGFKGDSGTSGYSGSEFVGSSGYSGFSGAKGDTGATGTSGYSGYSGKDGFIGGSGYSGYSGAKGDTGATGTSGYSGAKGDTGATGTSGISGLSGKSGYSGFSGESFCNDGTSNPVNLVINGNFEIWSDGTNSAPDGWTFVGGAGGVSRSDECVLGNYAVGLYREDGGVHLDQYIFSPGTSPFDPNKEAVNFRGKKLNISFWGSSFLANSARLTIYDGVNEYRSPYISAGGTWEKINFSCTLANATDRLLVMLEKVIVGDVKFDAIMITEGEVYCAYSEKPLTRRDFNVYTEISGTSPNQLTKVAYTDKNNNEIIISTNLE